MPSHLRRSLTWDQGAEMSQHARLRTDTGLQIYFCEPRSSWQRGTNENTNGLLRQYFPKGTDFSRYGVEGLQAVASALNNRPRKSLGWRTPAEAFNAEYAGILTRLGLLAESLSAAHVALRLAEDDPASIARALGALGEPQQTLVSPEVGIRNYETMLAKAREAGDVELQARAHRGLCGADLIRHQMGLVHQHASFGT